MRVLLAHNNFPVTGGAEVFYHQVGRVLEVHGNDVAYFSAASGDMSEWGSYFPEAADYKSDGLMERLIAFPAMVYSKKAKAAFAKLISDFRPDIIHVFAIYVKLTPSILDAAREAGVPVVMSCNDYKHICPNYKLYHHGHLCEECRGERFYRAAVNRCCHNSSVYSVASMLESYVHAFLNIYRKNVHTFLFASDFMARKTEEFWGADSFVWKKLGNPFDSTKYITSYSSTGSVLYFGRLIDEKGVDILIRAAAQLPDVSFRIVGDGPDMRALQKLSCNLGANNITFAGPKWGDDIERELQDCRMVVVPSVWYENYPYVINQAFAFGKPVIGSNRGGIPELVQHGERGLIYEASDPNALAGAVRQLWDKSDLSEVMGRNAKAFADSEFNDEIFYQSLKAIYTEVLA